MNAILPGLIAGPPCCGVDGHKPSCIYRPPPPSLRNVSFLVLGDPRPMGSKTAFAFMGKNGKPRAVVTDGSSSKPSVQALHSWKDSVSRAAYEAGQGRTFADGPLRIELTFTLARPSGHIGKAGNVRPSAPRRPDKKPDVDKLARQVLDCLTQAGLIRDDNRVVELVARKVYAEPGQPTGARIVVEEMA